MKVQLSVKQYALLISLLTLLLLAAFGWFSMQQLQQAEKEIHDWQHKLAVDELDKALARIDDKTRSIAASFAGWQEVQQQLERKEYYPYWKLHRSRSAPGLPDHIIDLAIYDRDGRILQKLPGQTLMEQLPGDLPENLPEPCVSTQPGGHSVLTAFSVVWQPLTGKLLGYVAIQMPLQNLLDEVGFFSFLDAGALQLNVPQGQEVPLLESQPYFSYQLKQDVISQAMDRYITAAGRQLMYIGLILSVVLYLYLAFVVAAPISLLMGHIKKLRDDSTQSKALEQPLKLKELDEIRVMLNRYHARLDNINRNLDRTNKELWNLAHHDALTGILNRRAFNDYWEFVQKESDVLGLMIIDINHFKALNDSYGHRIGDSVLKAVVECLIASLEDSEQLFRLGGDEFAYVAQNREIQAMQEMAQQCVQTVNDCDFSELGITEPVRISIGIAVASGGESEMMSLLVRQADIAIYQAKRPGSTGIVVYSESLGNQRKNLFSNKTYEAVYGAIEQGDGLHMFYQPIVSLEDDSICYYEALVRIRREQEWIYPDSIFPIIEARNLEQELDRAVIRQIAADLAGKRLPKNTGVSVNLSAASVARHDVAEWFEPLEAFLSTHDIVIEVTETALITQLEKATTNLEKLSNKGFRVALDDFGSGYSSIRYLSCMPVNIVKFDISLIRDLGNAEQQPIITGLSKIISGLGYSMVAEGIEDRQMLDNALAAGFKYAQGYLFGRPEQEPLQTLSL